MTSQVCNWEISKLKSCEFNLKQRDLRAVEERGKVRASNHTRLYLINFLMFWRQRIIIKEKIVSCKILKKVVKHSIKYFKRNSSSLRTPIVWIKKENCIQRFHYFMIIHLYLLEKNTLLRPLQSKVIINLISFFHSHGNNLSTLHIVIQEKN